MLVTPTNFDHFCSELSPFDFLSSSFSSYSLILYMPDITLLNDNHYILLGVQYFCAQLCNAMDWTPLSMGFPRQEYWSWLSFPSLGELPDPGIKPGYLACRWILYHLSHQGSPRYVCILINILCFGMQLFTCRYFDLLSLVFKILAQW